LIILITLFIHYYGFIKYDYIVPPGYDSLVHISLIKNIVNSGEINQDYPPGFHILIASLSEITGTHPMTTVKWIAPSLLVLSIFAVFLFTRNLFGQKTAIVTAFVYGLLSKQPTLTFSDGAYPNIINADFLLIFGFLFFLKAYINERKLDIIITGLFFGVVALFHSISFVYMLLVSFFGIIALLSYSLFKKENLKKKILIVIKILVVSLVLGLYPAWNYYLKNILVIIKGKLLGSEAIVLTIIGYTTATIPIDSYPEYIGYLVVYLGCLGLIYLVGVFKKERMYPHIFLFCWILTMFVASRSKSLFFFPERFARDIAIPLSISAGIFITNYFKEIYSSIMRYIFSLLLILIFAVTIPQIIMSELQENTMVLVQQVDYDASIWLEDNVEDNTNILTSPYAHYLKVLTNKNILTTHPNIKLVSLNDPVINQTLAFYNPSLKESKLFIHTMNISYIYAGKKPIGWTDPWFRYNYVEKLNKVNYLEMIKIFEDETGTIYIYKVDREKLKEELNQDL